MYFINKLKKRYKEGVLIRQIKRRVTQLLIKLTYLIYIFYDPNLNKIKIVSTHYIKPANNTKELEVVERIYESFKKMKHDQKKANKIYLPSSLWQDDIDYGYRILSEATQSNKIENFHFFLSNFGAWNKPTGVEYNSLITNNSRTFIGKSYLRNGVFNSQLKLWNWYYNNKKNISSLNMPRHGNLQGANIEKNFVVPGSFWNEIYGSMLNDIVSNFNSPIICDLGGGYGKLAYYTLKELKNFSFIDFDLPETLCLAAYYLMMTFPDKKAYLYGESKFNNETLRDNQLIFLPSFEIEKIQDDTVNLFINRNSLGEMSGDTANHFIKIITKKTKNYFFHMNHNNFRNFYLESDDGLLNDEYRISEKEFKKLVKYPDLGHLMYRGGVDMNEDIFFHLYEKLKNN